MEASMKSINFIPNRIILKKFFFCIAILLLFGCSDNPSKKEIESALLQGDEENYKMINLEIISIKKKEDIVGHKEYKIEINYIVEVVKPKPTNFIGFLGQREPLPNMVPNEVGDRLNFKGWLALVK